MKILYLHGFNSSSNSNKAQIFKNSKFVKNSRVEVIFPNLPISPKEAIKDAMNLVKKHNFTISLIGSSLGGFYATYISDTYNLKSVNINPVVPNHLVNMKNLIGEHQNYQSNENYFFTQEMYNFLDRIKINKLENPQNHLALVQLEDKVLNHLKTMSYYKNGHLCAETEGSHEYIGFENKIPYILDFLL